MTRLRLHAVVGAYHDNVDNGSARTDRRACAVLSGPGPAWVRRASGFGRSNGTRTRHRTGMAHQRTNARGDRDLPVAAGTARDPGRHLYLLFARRVLGCLGGRMGLHLPEFCNSSGLGCALRLPRRPPAGYRGVLWRESGGHRAHPALLLPLGEARDGRLVAVGLSASCTTAASFVVRRRRHCR